MIILRNMHRIVGLAMILVGVAMMLLGALR
jgi:hypothetical protein